MVSTLTRNRIFCAPPCSESFAFFSLTSRAITLVAVLPVELVSSIAVGPKSVFCSDRVAIFERILSRADKSQVAWRNATSCATDMVNIHTSRDISAVSKVRNSVGSSSHFSEKESAITVFIKRSLPKTTVTDLFPLAVKSFLLLLSNLHVPIVPYTPLVFKEKI